MLKEENRLGIIGVVGWTLSILPLLLLLVVGDALDDHSSETEGPLGYVIACYDCSMVFL